MGHSARLTRHKHATWVRRTLPAISGLVALGGALFLVPVQVAYASAIVVTVNSDTTRTDHREGVTYSMGPLPSGPIATFTDSGSGCPASCKPASAYTASVAWGDSTPASAGTITAPTAGSSTYKITASHAYADEDNGGVGGGFPIHVTVNGVSTGTGAIAVEDQPFQAGGAFTFFPTANQPFNGNIGVFQDANVLAEPLDQGGTVPEYTVTIDWGDGSATTSGTIAIAGCGTVSGLGAGQGCQMGVSGGPHTYTGTGSFTVNMQISDGADLKVLGCIPPATCSNPLTS